MKRYPSWTPSSITLDPPSELFTTAFESAGGVVVRQVIVSMATDTIVHGVPSISTATREGSFPKPRPLIVSNVPPLAGPT